MSASHVPRHPGLPVVPPPADGELLGSWLMRISQAYGLSLRNLLVRLAVVRTQRRTAPQWYELHLDHIHGPQLSAALHRPLESLSGMAAPQYCRRWTAEMGFCGQCLDEANLNGAPLGWQRSWMHPMALACEKHRSWLESVTVGRLREIRTSGDFGLLPRRNLEWSAPELRREALLIDGALWFQALVCKPAEHPPPWGKTEPDQLSRILRTLIQLLLSPAADEAVRHQLGRSPRNLPERRERWPYRALRVDDGINPPMTLPTPDHLRHRQFVLGLLGYYLRLPPSNRAPREPLAKLIAREVPVWQLARWPEAAAKWVSPPSARARHQPLAAARRKSSPGSRQIEKRFAAIFGIGRV
jgi:hypothetical protein